MAQALLLITIHARTTAQQFSRYGLRFAQSIPLPPPNWLHEGKPAMGAGGGPLRLHKPTGFWPLFPKLGKATERSLYCRLRKERTFESASRGEAYFKGELVRGLRCIAFNHMSSCNGRDIDRSLFIHQQAVAMVINLEKEEGDTHEGDGAMESPTGFIWDNTWGRGRVESRGGMTQPSRYGCHQGFWHHANTFDTFLPGSNSGDQKKNTRSNLRATGNIISPPTISVLY